MYLLLKAQRYKFSYSKGQLRYKSSCAPNYRLSCDCIWIFAPTFGTDRPAHRDPQALLMQPRPWLRDFVDRFTVTGTAWGFCGQLEISSSTKTGELESAMQHLALDRSHNVL
ncbi:hypothetical protein ACFL3U_05085 [Pseudomonadota bacterium]